MRHEPATNSEVVELNQNGSFRYLEQISFFIREYNGTPTLDGALDQYNGIPGGPAKAAAKALIQDIYDRIPFLEMKRNGHDWYVRAPQ